MKIDVDCFHPAFWLFPGVVVEEINELLPSLPRSRFEHFQQKDVPTELDVVLIGRQIGAARRASSPAALTLVERETPVMMA